MKKLHSQFMINQIAFDMARKIQIMPVKVSSKYGVRFLLKNGEYSPYFSHAYNFSQGFTCGKLKSILQTDNPIIVDRKVYMDMVGNITPKPTEKGLDLYKFAMKVEKYGLEAIKELDANYFLDTKFCEYVVWRYLTSAKIRMNYKLAQGETIVKDQEFSAKPALDICKQKIFEAKQQQEECCNQKN